MELDGYLNVLKPSEWTSHDVVARLRRLIGVHRIGHTGTLDPAAIGVLPVALGRATRTVSSPAWNEKEYLADIAFGTATDTDDAQGRVVATGDPTTLDIDVVCAALPAFRGTISQRPPAYSAVHVRGERAYRLAHRGVADLLAERVVHIDGISVVGWRPPVLSLRLQCHSGTYIRALARDLGALVGCPAHLAGLVRLRVGPFGIGSALDIARLEALAVQNSWAEVVWPLDVACRHLCAIVLPPARAADMAHGRAWSARPALSVSKLSEGKTAVAYTADGEILGLVREQNNSWQPTRGLRPGGVAPG